MPPRRRRKNPGDGKHCVAAMPRRVRISWIFPGHRSCIAYNCDDRLERFERLVCDVGFEVRIGDSRRPAPNDDLIQGSKRCRALVRRFLRDDSGATAIEYGLIAAGIAVVIITAVQLVGTNLTTTFNSVANSVR